MTSHNDLSFRSVTGAPESAEPAATTPSHTSMATNRPQPPASASDSGPSRQQALRSLNVSGSPSTANSPLSSRDTSPIRQQNRQSGPSGPLPKSGLRSRKSSTDVSPNRGPSLAGSSTTVPSAAAIQRALSAASIPQLPPTNSQDPARVPRPAKSASGTNSGENTPHWPVSPRLKSPPPASDARSRSRRNSLRNQSNTSKKADPPSIVVQSSSPAPASRIPVKEDVNSDPEEQPLSMKATSRGASGAAPKLETVQEGSLPTTPGFEGLEVQSILSQSAKSSDDERNDVTSTKVSEDLSPKATRHIENGSEALSKTDKGKMQDQRSASTQRPNALPSKASYSSLTAIKPQTDAPTKNMTVETETVPSIAQATISNQERSASGRGDGSLRLKPSNETIRPKKEKQRPKRKAPSINSGTGRSPHAHVSYHHHRPSRSDYDWRPTRASPLGSPVSRRSYDDRRSNLAVSPADSELSMHRLPIHSPSFVSFISSTNSSFRKASSKADVFEQKVASAVDEANSSDSDNTFIYESNPPEPQQQQQQQQQQQPQPHRNRHHSRTPSMTSVTSLADPRTIVREAHRNANKKPSMKFANPYNHQNGDGEGYDRGEGTLRGGSGRISGGSHHHHIGRHGQGRGALNHLLVDTDPSAAQPSRSRGASSRHTSQPNSPRFHTFNVGNANGNGNGNGIRKQEEYSTYDIDTENAADDERTPLIHSIRSPRVRTPRGRNPNPRHMERRHRRDGGWCRRFAGCLVLSILLLVLVFSSVGLVFATTKPLSNVKVREVQNVIASDQELMLDLVVEAVNPNIIAVTVSDMDVNIFAKSKHVGSDKWWREHGGRHHNEESWNPIKALEDSEVDEGSVHITDGVDEGTDPIDDPEVGEPRNMLLGRIFHFDSSLVFEGSFFNRRRVESIGAVRLSKPGNKTEAGGTERWEEVLQYPFELIVRGVLKYELPLSTREHSVSITASYYYDPDTEKKKLKVASSELDSRNLSPKPLTILPTSHGRFDVRARRPLSLVEA
ncbi:hypothetical protein EJ04DRAFT_444133 [Polyplosphaeria fusca]|uniref:Uncharacterized protein n=1 Tax=Polyplosphaeria fusca TaxID=682080 RepID=A0A9P4QT43_9PLEO|nr:hypothetical protein EJ04DRAFT_444133 [Polyplosphaeria fusca]